MKKNLIKCLAVAGALVLAITGCGQVAPQPSASASASATASASVEASTEATAAASSEPAAATAPTNVTYFHWKINTKTVQDFKETLWIKELEKKANVTIEFQGPNTGDDYNQAASIMLASGTMSDMFYYDWNRYAGGLAGAIADGIVVNVSKSYADKMPTWFGILEGNEAIKRAVTLDDGTSALFCHLELDLKRGAYAGNWIRGDWLEKLSMPVPTTIDDFYKSLVAFKDKDPNGNGKADEIPFADDKNFDALKTLAGAWGLVYQDIQMDPATPGKVTYWPLVNGGKNFTDFVTTLNKWYKEKLIDQEFASQDGAQREAKILTDMVGSSFAYTGNYATWSEGLKAAAPNAKLSGMVPLVGMGGKAYSTNNALVRPAASNEGTCVTTLAEKDGSIEACLRLLDLMYTKEGSDIIGWGVEGVSYNVGADGRKTWSDAVTKDPEFKFNDMVFKFALPTWGGFPKIMSYDAWASIELTTEESVQAHENYFAADTGILTPPLLLSQAESEEYNRIMTDVNTAIGENFTKMVLGTTPLTEIPNLLKQLNDMGLEKAMAMYQGAYDRYSKK